MSEALINSKFYIFLLLNIQAEEKILKGGLKKERVQAKKEHSTVHTP